MTISIKQSYEEEGYLTGFTGLDANEALGYLQTFENEAFKASTKGLIQEEFIYKPHLILKVFNELIFKTKITNVVRELLGKDIVCWTTMMFYKKSDQLVGFHQDLKYWEFENSNCLTVSLALSDSSRKNGCLVVVPKSHNKNFNHAMNRDQKNNMLVYSQSVKTNNSKKVHLELKPGQFSIHHGDIVHGSEPNKTKDPRALLAIRYCSADNASKIYGSGSWKGLHTYVKFTKEPEIAKDFDSIGINFRERLLRDLTLHHAKALISISLFKLCKIFIATKTVRKVYYFLRSLQTRN